MFHSEDITNKSDSLIELLTAQCADLEKLLNLAREETLAAEQGNFLGILDIVSDRERIGEKLETFQRQIAELRNGLGETNESVRRNEITKRVVEIANMTINQDKKTQLLLNTSRERSVNELNNLEKSFRGNNAYLREQQKGLAYDKSF
jgi:flagellar biosynthesis/type III secretory pathway chaperone